MQLSSSIILLGYFISYNDDVKFVSTSMKTKLASLNKASLHYFVPCKGNPRHS